MTDPNRPLRIGIVGANWSLKVHGTAWRMLPGIEVGAVCTAHRETAEAAAQMFGVPKAYWDPASAPPSRAMDFEEASSETRRLVSRAVARRTMLVMPIPRCSR